MYKMLGLLAVVPATGLLALSFFVMVVLRKMEQDALKVFGYVVTALLWGCALLVFMAGVYKLSANHYKMQKVISGATEQASECPIYKMRPGNK